MNELLRRHHLPPLSFARYQQVFDFPVRGYYEQLGFDFSRTPFEQVGSEFIDRYEQHRPRLRLQPGARTLLARLHARGIDQIVLSAYRHDTLEDLLAAKGVRGYFTHVAGADDHYARGKTEQGIALRDRLGLVPRTTLLIGDTVHDAEVAAAMGIDCLLLNAGHQTRARLEATGAPVFNHLADLAPLLLPA
jgi:phosphoglycolate phosphatase